VKNILALLIGKFANGRYIIVRYEDLVTNPKQKLDEIGRLCGLNLRSVGDQLTNGNALNIGHQIGGNARARGKRNSVQLAPDQEWQKHLSISNRIIFWLFAGQLAKRLGYR
jgi:hypothetical protein